MNITHSMKIFLRYSRILFCGFTLLGLILVLCIYFYDDSSHESKIASKSRESHAKVDEKYEQSEQEDDVMMLIVN